MKVTNKVIVPAGTVMNTTINSQAIDMQQLWGCAIQAVFTATPTGTFKIQASSDPATSYNSGNGQGANPIVNWTDVANSSYAVTASGNYMWNIFDVCYNWVRLVYTDTSGGTSTATLMVQINAKGV